MKILYYQTNHRADNICRSAMQKLGCQVEPFSCPLQEEEQEQRFLPLIRQLIREQHPDAIYSFDYFSALSEACQEEGILYISYCCDAPTLAMFSKNIANTCNRILTADSLLVEGFRSRGAKEAYYLPLAPILQAEGEPENPKENLVFVGSLHENNMYQYFSKLPEDIRGYLDGITAAQVHVYGYSLFADLMENDFWSTMMQNFSLGKTVDSEEKFRYMIEHYFLEQQTTSLERTMAVKRLSECYPEKFCLYTRSKSPVLGMQCGGYVPYGKKLVDLYQNSAIVLNITNRAHMSGIPQNAWDILACGGFLLSNYQADYNGVLEPGKDFVVYGGMEELMELAGYYLAHPLEREEIARNGQQKILAGHHTWWERAGAILSLLE